MMAKPWLKLVNDGETNGIAYQKSHKAGACGKILKAQPNLLRTSSAGLENCCILEKVGTNPKAKDESQGE